MLSANKVNQCGSRKPNTHLILPTYVMDLLPRDWDGRSNVRSMDIFLRSPPEVAILGPDLTALHNIKKKYPWRRHQSVVHGKKGRCSWEACPNLTLGEAKRKRGYDTFMRCEECSIEKGTNVFFCNNVKGFVDGEQGRKEDLCMSFGTSHEIPLQ